MRKSGRRDILDLAPVLRVLWVWDDLSSFCTPDGLRAQWPGG
jgi:hypothetical protein